MGVNTGSISVHTDLIDKLPIVHEALFDSYANQYEDECLPGTRTEISHQIREWALSPQGSCMFWLNGMAGTGKSTISRSVAKAFKESGSLGASFFFKRHENDRRSALKLFPTIAGQLATHIPQLAAGIQRAIQNDSGIATKALREQFDKLLLQPLLRDDVPASPVPTLLIVIDALDECEVDNDMRLVI